MYLYIQTEQVKIYLRSISIAYNNSELEEIKMRVSPSIEQLTQRDRDAIYIYTHTHNMHTCVFSLGRICVLYGN